MTDREIMEALLAGKTIMNKYGMPLKLDGEKLMGKARGFDWEQDRSTFQHFAYTTAGERTSG